ncbi:hypothetical protein NP493_245g03013 [Ridgeia piscesae]|uniref:Uncharacterized protein n=1 Tax=Ridgeia piscesae TaxID=27915 RepID=A0AAD9NZ95_RIDPI|nr:hypothetical protein NP493_245g03013 [Ridgeia piscesae]
MRVTVIILLACFTLAALADDKAAQLEKTDEESLLSLGDVDEDVADRYKRESNQLPILLRITRSNKKKCSISCTRGSCKANCKKCGRCKCFCRIGRPQCKCYHNKGKRNCKTHCKKRNCKAKCKKCIGCECRCAIWNKPKCDCW